jgi:sulfite reductase (NADPH) flavoprotein alpha-component
MTKPSRFSWALAGNAIALLLLAALMLFALRWQNSAPVFPAPDHVRLLWALLAVAAYLLFCLLLLGRRGYQRRRAVQAAAALLQGGGTPWLVAYASQTGFAEQLAWQTAQALQSAGLPVRLLPFAELDAALLMKTEKALFIVSTTGEGDAPDAAAGFARRLLASALPLPDLEYGLLALGDREYTQFCAFGHVVDHWLHHQGARLLFDRIDVDNGDAGALRHWQHHLSLLTGSSSLPDWSAPGYERWRLLERECLNPQSAGAPVFRVAFVPAPGAALLQWQAGDIVEVGPCNAAAAVEDWLQATAHNGASPVSVDGGTESLHVALSRLSLPRDEATLTTLRELSAQALVDTLKLLPHREYSIASLPADGRIELLLRQFRQPDGSLGVGSGWLTEFAPVGADIRLRIRENRSFHGPSDARPLILIANGTGLAGLRAHIKARAAAGRYRNWLLFGERNADKDFFFREEILGWRQSGVLEKLDLAFSRDGGDRAYVQQRLQEASGELREWVAAGAAIYVCGSLKGMAPAVAEVLGAALGEPLLEAMAEDGRYRRDVY